MTEMVDVVVVGAGLAGLAAAAGLHRAGLSTHVLEAEDGVGGRVRTDRRDGLLLDRGFQLLNPAYPAVTRLLDLEALDLCPFRPGVAVRLGGRLHVLADPLRWPAALPGTLSAPVGSWREKLALARWAAEAGYGPAARIKHGADQALTEALQRRGLNGRLGESALRPFLSGVLADADLSVSRRVGELILRSFVRGTPALPASGMRAIPEQLAAQLPPGTVTTGTRAEAITGTTVHTAAGTQRGRAVLVACDPPTAAGLLDLSVPACRALTTYYHHADQPPTRTRLLHVDGDRAGPVVNTAVVSNVAAGYSERGALIASTVLGAHDDELEPQVRVHAGRIYGAQTRSWQHVATYPITTALPAMPPGQPLRQPVALGDGHFVAGDHRDTPSIQGALASGDRAARALIAYLRR